MSKDIERWIDRLERAINPDPEQPFSIFECDDGVMVCFAAQSDILTWEEYEDRWPPEKRRGVSVVRLGVDINAI